MKLKFNQIVIIILSLLLFGNCSGGYEFRKASEITPSPILTEKEKPRKRTLSSSPSAYYHFLLSQMKLKEGKLDESIEHLKKALSEDEKEPFLHD